MKHVTPDGVLEALMEGSTKLKKNNLNVLVTKPGAAVVGTTMESTSIPLDGSSMEAAVVVTTASSVETVVTAALVVAASSAGSSGLWVEVNDALSSTIGAEVTGTLSSFNVEDSGTAVVDSFVWGQAIKSH